MKNFEERLARLEKISEKIQDTNLPLEDAFGLFEEGMKLASSLEKDVEKLEGNVQILINGENLEKAESDKKKSGAKTTEPAFELFSDESLNQD